MLGHVEVEDAAAAVVVGKPDEDEEDAPVGGGHREDIEGDQVADLG